MNTINALNTLYSINTDYNFTNLTVVEASTVVPESTAAAPAGKKITALEVIIDIAFMVLLFVAIYKILLKPIFTVLKIILSPVFWLLALIFSPIINLILNIGNDAYCGVLNKIGAKKRKNFYKANPILGIAEGKLSVKDIQEMNQAAKNSDPVDIDILKQELKFYETSPELYKQYKEMQAQSDKSKRKTKRK